MELMDIELQSSCEPVSAPPVTGAVVGTNDQIPDDNNILLGALVFVVIVLIYIFLTRFRKPKAKS